MTPRTAILILVLFTLSTLSQSQTIRRKEKIVPKDHHENDIKIEDEDMNPFAEAANAFVQGGNMGDIGNMLNNVMQGEGGKAIENILMGAAQNGDATNQILSGIGAMLNNQNAGAALDPSVLSNMISLMGNPGDTSKKSNDIAATLMSAFTNLISKQHPGQKDLLDLGSIIGTIVDFFKKSGENPINLLFSMFDSFFGPEAKLREHQHAGHAFLLPPLLEKAHLYFDHFKHTELYKALWRVTGGEKFFNMFSVDGKFNFGKFFERLENRSFRRHWISQLVKKVTDIIAILTDPERYKKYLSTGVSLFNGFLKSVEFPKATLFDITRPTETLTNLFNYFFKKYLNLNVDSRQYVQPAVKYVEEVLRLAHHKGFLMRDGINSQELAHKLTDTINLEIIEPLARVYRAYRFAKRVPDCDKYVMCIINQEDPHEVLSLPGLKVSLSRTASLFAGWFLSQYTGTSFWTLYSTINDEKDCSIRFVEKCNEFHIEEIRVHAEYEHTEL